MPLLYLGISLKNQQKHPLADEIKFCTNQELISTKVSHDEYPLLLDTIKALGFVDELSLISTCNRFEIICYIHEQNLTQANIDLIQSAIRSITRSETILGQLIGAKAEYQFLRTFCGLNSGLIGESEISQQIEISIRQALVMGYMARQGAELLDKAIKLRAIITERIYKERVSYCQVGLLTALQGLKLQSINKAVVMGSGSTAHESCKALVDYGLPSSSIYLAHRISSSSGQISKIKSTPGLENMNYLRSKYGYHTDKIKLFVSDADLLVFAIDSKNPVMEFSRNYRVKIVDFNSKPSCSFEAGADLSSYVSGERLDDYVRSYSRDRLQDPEFCQSIELVDTTIANALGVQDARRGYALIVS